MLLVGQTPGRSGDSICRSRFEDLKSGHDHFRDIIAKDIDFNERAVPVEPGIYTCILSPMAAGVFAHESFGHKSEADFMVGDETMKQEWTLGKQVGAPLLSQSPFPVSYTHLDVYKRQFELKAHRPRAVAAQRYAQALGQRDSEN